MNVDNSIKGQRPESSCGCFELSTVCSSIVGAVLVFSVFHCWWPCKHHLHLLVLLVVLAEPAAVLMFPEELFVMMLLAALVMSSVILSLEVEIVVLAALGLVLRNGYLTRAVQILRFKFFVMVLRRCCAQLWTWQSGHGALCLIWWFSARGRLRCLLFGGRVHCAAES